MPLKLHLHDCYDPLQQADLDAFEAAHCIHLPDDYRELLLRYNGGRFRHHQVCPVSDERFRATASKGVALMHWVGIDPLGYNELARNIEFATNNRLPIGFLFIASDPIGNQVALAISGPEQGKLYFWINDEWHYIEDDNGGRTGSEELPGHDLDGLYHLADSLEQFCDNIYEDHEPASAENPIFESIRLGELTQLTSFLTRQNDSNTIDGRGRSLLMYAANESRTTAVTLLLHHGADINLVDSRGRAAIHYAILGQAFDALKILVSNGADVNRPDTNGVTPLLESIECLNARMSLYLIDHGADVSAITINGQTALSLVEKKSFRHCQLVKAAIRMRLNA